MSTGGCSSRSASRGDDVREGGRSPANLIDLEVSSTQEGLERSEIPVVSISHIAPQVLGDTERPSNELTRSIQRSTHVHGSSDQDVARGPAPPADAIHQLPWELDMFEHIHENYQIELALKLIEGYRFDRTTEHIMAGLPGTIGHLAIGLDPYGFCAMGPGHIQECATSTPNLEDPQTKEVLASNVPEHVQDKQGLLLQLGASVFIATLEDAISPSPTLCEVLIRKDERDLFRSEVRVDEEMCAVSTPEELESTTESCLSIRTLFSGPITVIASCFLEMGPEGHIYQLAWP